MKKVLILTNIRPDALNRGGPSGLIWEIIEYLKRDNFVEVLYFSINKLKKLAQLGISFKKIDIDYLSFDQILVYPNYMFSYINSKYHNKVIVLGPDSTSFLFRRLHRISSGFNKLKYFILYNWFFFYEKNLIKKCKHLLLVGNNDKRWLLNDFIETLPNKIVWLHHPILKSTIYDINEISKKIYKGSKRRYIFAGDLNYKYVGRFIEELYENLNLIQTKNSVILEIIIIGVNNKWVYDIFSKLGNSIVRYEFWVDDYRDYCVAYRDVHCIPLKAGAGTKNRTLTALANGITIITTSIGMENICRGDISGNVQVANTPQKFAQCMYNTLFSASENFVSLESVKSFRKGVKDKFEADLKKYF